MGREIRMVPPNWQHPKRVCHHRNLDGRPWCDEAREDGGLCYQPMHDEDFASAAAEWKEEFAKYDPSEHDGSEFWEWHGSPPDREYYRSEAWTESEATHFQIYETVSEGTPVSPVFASRDELAAWLIANGTSAEAAKKFAETGFCFSMMFGPGGIKEGYETLT